MSLHEKYGLTRIINARGTYTPLGVSRSSKVVSSAVADALGEFFIIDELQALICREVNRITGAQAAAVTHCVSAGITLSVAAAMTGTDSLRIKALPDTSYMPNRAIIPAGHAVDYGHPILTDIRLAGAEPVLIGDRTQCSIDEIEAALRHKRTACLLLVSSRLVSGKPVDMDAAIATAHAHDVPVIIDGAAQDIRAKELLATGADAILLSAHKYMASPTAGLILGQRAFIDAFRAQDSGIGRAMKATKEALLGVLAALEERESMDIAVWCEQQDKKVAWFIENANGIPGLHASEIPDPAGMPFSRVCLRIAPELRSNTLNVSQKLREGTPSIWVMDHASDAGHLFLELVPLSSSEMQIIIERLESIVRGSC